MNIARQLLGTSALFQANMEQGQAEPAPAKPAPVSVQNEAQAEGSKMEEGVANVIESLILKGEDVRAAPLDVYFAMLRAGELDELPRVGTHHEKNRGETNRYETFQARDTDGKLVEVNYFTEYFRATSVGRKWSEYVDALKSAKAGAEADAKLWPEIHEHRHDQHWLEDEISLFTQRISGGRTLVRNCARIRDRLDDLNDYDGIEITWNQVSDGKGGTRMKRTKYPFFLVNSENPGERRRLSISDLWNLKIDKAEENGGGYHALADTIKRGTKKTPPAGQAKHIEKFEEAQDYINELSVFFDSTKEEGRKRLRFLAAALSPENPKRDEIIGPFGDLVVALDSEWNSDIEKRWRQLRGQKQNGNGETKAA